MAKFREKCSISSAALSELIKQIDQKTQTEAKTNCIVIKQIPKTDHCKEKIEESNSNSSEIFYVDGYDQDNVEYVVLDSSEFIEETHSIEYTTESLDHHRQEKVVRAYFVAFCSFILFITTCYSELSLLVLQELQHISIEVNTEDEDIAASKTDDSEDGRTSQKTTINFICKLCGAGFAQSNNLQRHLLTHNDNELTAAEQFPCTHCCEIFSK